MISIDIQKQLIFARGKMNLDVQLNLENGSFTTLYGNSGAGKTSVLRMLAGLMIPDSGKIEVHGKPWFDSTTQFNLKAQQRKVGFVFQDYALFPNMTVLENLRYAKTKGQDDSIIMELMKVVELDEFKNLKPATLSGGQQQRVALARTLVCRPQILMLDEPLSALDLEMRGKLQKYLKRIHEEFDLTTILVSHDVSEITALSDLVCQIENGQVVKTGAPAAILQNAGYGQEVELSGIIESIETTPEGNWLTVSVNQSQVKFLANGGNYAVGDKISFKGNLQNMKASEPERGIN